MFYVDINTSVSEEMISMNTDPTKFSCKMDRKLLYWAYKNHTIMCHFG